MSGRCAGVEMARFGPKRPFGRPWPGTASGRPRPGHRGLGDRGRAPGERGPPRGRGQGSGDRGEGHPRRRPFLRAWPRSRTRPRARRRARPPSRPATPSGRSPRRCGVTATATAGSLGPTGRCTAIPPRSIRAGAASAGGLSRAAWLDRAGGAAQPPRNRSTNWKRPGWRRERRRSATSRLRTWASDRPRSSLMMT